MQPTNATSDQLKKKKVGGRGEAHFPSSVNLKANSQGGLIFSTLVIAYPSARVEQGTYVDHPQACLQEMEEMLPDQFGVDTGWEKMTDVYATQGTRLDGFNEFGIES